MRPRWRWASRPIPGSGGSATLAALLGEVPDADWNVPVQVFEDDILFIQWSAVSEKSRIRDGVDTFVFRDGLIRVQTLFHTLEPVS